MFIISLKIILQSKRFVLLRYTLSVFFFYKLNLLKFTFNSLCLAVDQADYRLGQAFKHSLITKVVERKRQGTTLINKSRN